MRVLAIDTALDACSAAVLDTKRGAMLASETLPMIRGHAEALVPLIARIMAKAAIPFEKLDRIAVTTGPGSFTGLRVGISAARGIALASGKPAVGLSTLAAYAAPRMAEDDGIAVAAAVDARHGHVYLQVFGGTRPIGPCIASLEDAARAAGEQARLVGSAAGLVAAAWPQDRQPPSAVEPRPAPDIRWVARLGAVAAERNSPRPLYLRAPDAQPQDARRLPRR
jgi:tRNA threonylcarbamoyladenosine biosynthesis protein TsaB